METKNIIKITVIIKKITFIIFFFIDKIPQTQGAAGSQMTIQVKTWRYSRRRLDDQTQLPFQKYFKFFFLNFSFLLFSFFQNYFRSSFRSIFDSSGRIFLRFPSFSRHPNSPLEAKITTSLSPDLHYFQMHRGFVSTLHIFSHLRILIIFIFNFSVLFRRNSDGQLNGA